MAALRVCVLFTVTALTVGILYVYHRLSFRRKSAPLTIKVVVPEQLNQKHTPSASEQVTDESTILAPNQVSPAEIDHLVTLLSSSNTNKFTKIMKTLVQFSNNNVNMPSFRQKKTLDSLSSQIILGGDGGFLRTVNVFVLSLFSNLVVDDIIREYIKTKVDRFFDTHLSTLAEEELVAVLRLLANLSLLKDGCQCVQMHVADIYEILDNDNNQVQRQVWTLLLNLSCDRTTIPHLLQANAFTMAGKTIVNLMTVSVENEIILEKELRFLCTMYSSLLTQPLTEYSIGSMGEQLISVKSDVKERSVILTLITTNSNSVLYSVAKRLADILH